MTIPRHNNWGYRDKISFWSGSDYEEKFKLNLADPVTQALLKQYQWLEPECITYQFNSHGFRDQQFDNRNCGLAFGCSFTQGVGVAEQDTWPRLLSKMLGIHVWNLGIGGCALDTIYRISEYYIHMLKPKFVVLLVPPPWRVEYATSNTDFELLLPTTLQANNAGSFVKNWFANEVNSILNRKKNIQALSYICQGASTPLYMLDTQKLGNDCCARDLLHPGRQYHLKISDLFNSMISC
jgi:hypothetical protein